MVLSRVHPKSQRPKPSAFQGIQRLYHPFQRSKQSPLIAPALFTLSPTRMLHLHQLLLTSQASLLLLLGLSSPGPRAPASCAPRGVQLIRRTLRLHPPKASVHSPCFRIATTALDWSKRQSPCLSANLQRRNAKLIARTLGASQASRGR